MSDIQDIKSKLIDGRKIAYIDYGSVSKCGVFDFTKIIPLIEEVYRIHAKQDFEMPNSDYLKYRGRSSYDRVIVLLGYLGGKFNISGVKEICSSVKNRERNLPRASGIICLNDPATQRVFAIIEASQISAARTAAVTAVALKYLKPAQTSKVAFIGCGYLARVHANMLRQLYGNRIGKVHIYDINKKAMDDFVAEAKKEDDLCFVKCKNAEEAIREADIIIPMTTEQNPYIRPEWIKDGSLYSAVSLLDPWLDVLKKSDYIIVDDEKLCKHEGRPLQRLEQAGDLKKTRLTTIGRIITGDAKIRITQKTKVFFNPMGTVLTDLAVASHILQEAVDKKMVKYLDA